MRQRRSRTRYHPCKGEREVRPSRRNWSSWCLGWVQPGVQKSHSPESFVLLLRRPPCTRESSRLLARLPSWRDMAAELHAPDVLHARLSFSSHPKSRPASCSIDRNSCPFRRKSCPFFPAVYRIFPQRVDIHPPAWIHQTRTLLAGGRGICPQEQPRSPSVACQGNLSAEETSYTSVFVDLRHGQETFGRLNHNKHRLS